MSQQHKAEKSDDAREESHGGMDFEQIDQGRGTNRREDIIINNYARDVTRGASIQFVELQSWAVRSFAWKTSLLL